ncbi:hypothetical protein ABIB48_001526 [Arthrobacter sp. UYCu511]
MDYSGWRGIGTVVQHPDDAGLWIGGSAQLPFLGSDDVATRGLPAALGEVSAVVSLCRVGQDAAPLIAAENHATFWLIDSADPAENAHLDFVLRDAAEAVARFRAEGHTVYLHCVQAESRTPTVAALYGAMVSGGSELESLERISRALSNAHPNGAFMDVLRGTASVSGYRPLTETDCRPPCLARLRLQEVFAMLPQNNIHDAKCGCIRSNTRFLLNLLQPLRQSRSICQQFVPGDPLLV